MAINYRIYQGDSAGGPVDYTTVVATVTGLTWTGPALPLSSSTRFAVRAYDTVTGLDDANTDAQTLIVVDSAGADATNRPYAPSSLRAMPRSSGSVLVEWTYPHRDKFNQPTGFHVYVGTPTPSYASPAATVLWAAGLGTLRFRATVTGLTAGTAYQAVVRAYNASGEEPNTAAADFTPPASAPSNVGGLTANVGY